MTEADQQALAEAVAVRNRNVYGNIMRLAEGRAWMFDLLEMCHIGMNPFSSDPLVMAHNAGEMNIGLRLWNHLMVYCPDEYILMMSERKALEDERRARSSGPSTDEYGRATDSGFDNARVSAAE